MAVPSVLFKNARLDDGLLDVLVFQNQSHWDLIRYFQAIVFGNHPALPDVEYFQSRGLRLTSRTEQVPVEIDGELTGTVAIRIRVFNWQTQRSCSPRIGHGKQICIGFG